MASLNKLEIIGHLGRDPESRFTADGKQVVTFSVAATEKWQGGSHTEWFSIVAWQKLAEICIKFLKKGSMVFIEGTVKTREYEGRDGTKRKVTEVIAKQMIMLGGTQNATQQPAQAASSTMPEYDGGAITDDQIPF